MAKNVLVYGRLHLTENVVVGFSKTSPNKADGSYN